MRLPWGSLSSVVGGSVAGAAPAGAHRPRPVPRRGGLGGGLDHLVEDELAVLDAVSAVVRERRVAVLVDGVLPEDRVTVLDVEERVDDGRAVVALVTGVLDRLQH